ncbi:MAG: hypothetical protein ETSY1_01790 [Candidatus Entotheonella factor]|uniref:DUF4126 domain-containing protein n=1 Tax=Entotheonella factor TaxID=1429438 RepID=W4LZX9_ENTF1|nr:MAG: hypothetical protein ETSY1_01790 [Candidatus Entotheonella factor]
MDVLLAIFLGIGLSAACGFRVFVPFLVMSVTKLSGQLEVAPGFDWVGTWPAFIALLVATITEIAAYYIPWVDNALDTIATPAAAVAGAIASSSAVTDLSPFLEWMIAIIGGGVVTTVQVSTVVLRGVSTGTTGGFANPVIATSELAGSTITSVVSIIVPAVAVALIAAGVVVAALIFKRKLASLKSEPADHASR